MIIRTSRLVIRPWQRSDLAAMAEWPPFPDPLDAPWNWPQRLHAEGTANLFYLTRAGHPSRRDWTITTGMSHVIGHLGIRNIRARTSARLGIGLGYPFIGQGFGTEAMRGFLEHYFGKLGFGQLELDVAEYNLRALHVYGRLGFQTVGRSWRPAGNVADFAFLDTPAYTSLRTLFDSEGTTMLVRSVDMLLAADDWLKGRAMPHGS